MVMGSLGLKPNNLWLARTWTWWPRAHHKTCPVYQTFLRTPSHESIIYQNSYCFHAFTNGCFKCIICSYKTYRIKLHFDLHYVFPITIDSLRPKSKNSAHGSRQDIEMVWNMSRDQSQRESFVICPRAGAKTFILIFLTYMVFLELHVLKVFLLGSMYKFPIGLQVATLGSLGLLCLRPLPLE
jgi:hypothetical protein